MLDTDHNWHPYVKVVEAEGHVEVGDVVARSARWSLVGRATDLNGVCAEPGCPQLTDGGTCPDHGGLAENSVGGVRVRLACPLSKCRYDGVHSGAHLLAEVAAAVVARRGSVRLTS